MGISRALKVLAKESMNIKLIMVPAIACTLEKMVSISFFSLVEEQNNVRIETLPRLRYVGGTIKDERNRSRNNGTDKRF
jgi:hypothetical protein